MLKAGLRDDLQGKLLTWYYRHKRIMPWRAEKGQTPDPYHVWLSEIMLQQTTVTAVKPYFENFVALWPTVFDLAGAEADDVMHAWAGLGYYARARNLHKCAKTIVNQYDGSFPSTSTELVELPGIGPYTAAAIASIAFDENIVAVDGNVERVAARFFAVREPMPKSKPLLKELALDMGYDNPAPSDFTQAFMELGATICTPKSPKCALCPWMEDCKARQKGIAADLPKREAKKKKPKRKGAVFWVIDGKGAVFVRKRPSQGLLGGMYEFPSIGWSADHEDDGALMALLHKNVTKAVYKKAVRHVFTHFELTLDIHVVKSPTIQNKISGQWVKDPDQMALPSVMQKVKRFVEKSL